MSYSPGRPGSLARRRLEQDMEAEFEADVEFFDHPRLGRVRLRDLLVADRPSDTEL